MTAARPSRVAQQGQGRSACPNPPARRGHAPLPRSPRPRGDHRIILVGQNFPACRRSRAAGLAGRRAGRAHHRAKESEPPCGKIWPWPATARPVDHRPLLDPWGLARACCGPTPPLPRSGRREAGQPGSRASDRHPQGRDWTAEPTIAAPRGLARDETGGAGKGAKEGQGARLGAQAGAAGRSLERGPGQRTGCAKHLTGQQTPLMPYGF